MRVHFIGIGGAGMSGIALVMHDRGEVVTGSDMKESRYTRSLIQAGVPVSIGHDVSALGDLDVVVVSSAIREDNPELLEARRRGVEIWPRARMLAHLAGGCVTIAIAGTHGKTSTSAMVATILAGIGADPTFVVGGELSAFGTNAKSGSGDHYVVEADESDGSFVFLEPAIALVTNVEADHLDHHGSLEVIEDVFHQFMMRSRPDGTLVVCADDERLIRIASDVPRTLLTYGFSETADVRCHSLAREGEGHKFLVDLPDGRSVEAVMRVPGEHMVQNATGALAALCAAGLDVHAAAAAFDTYGGVKRRFDRVGESRGVTVVDDYAHHPTEIRATLAAARQCQHGRVWAVFQPHRYSRTSAFAREFGEAFTDADRLVVMDVYSAGEPPVPGVTGKTVVESVLVHTPRARVAYLPHRVDVPGYISLNARPGDLVLTMGAGDVTSMGPEILRALAPLKEAGSPCQ